MPSKKTPPKRPASQPVDPSPQLAPEQASEPVTPTAADDECTKLRAELAEKHDRLLRALADYENLQKRSAKELAARDEACKKHYLITILDFYELLQKAADDQSPQEGIRSLCTTLEQFFHREGVTAIDCKGQPFDYCRHHALSTVETGECPEGTVLEEVKKGYFLGDKLLRPAHVIVSAHKEAPPKED